MTDEELGDLARRLVVRRKADGRGVYDKRAKAELVAEAGRPERSISRLARQCGINANQLTRWLREDRDSRGERVCAIDAALPSPFVPMTIEAPAAPSPPQGAASISMQVRLPNGAVIDVRDGDYDQIKALLNTLGSLPCSASTRV